MPNFFSKKKSDIVIAVVVTLLLLGVTALAIAEKAAGETWYGPLAIALSAAAGALALISIPNKIFGFFRNLIFILGIPFCAVLLVQNFTLNPLGEKGIYPMMLLANCVFFYLIYLFLAFLCGSFRIGYSVASAVFSLIGIANYFVVQFRSSPIVPWDLYSIGTAASVADNYTYSFSWRFVSTFIAFGLLFVLGTRITWKISLPVIRIIGMILTAGLFVCSVYSLQKKEVKDWLGMDQTLFTPNVRYRNNGFLAAFLGNIHLINVQEPSGYSVRKVEEIVSQTAAGDIQEAALEDFDASKAPNIIVIIDEAFSDLQVRGEFGVDQDYMPYFRSMMEDQTGGHLMVSVKGGNTANSEYELVSGDTMAFLPAGSVVYQQFIRDTIPVIPSQLASLGYATTAIHPYLRTGWERDRVYELIGFEKFLAQEDFIDPQYIRNYISDVSAFDKIIEVMENADPSEPQFIFEVTMQNHSGYSKEFPGFTEKIHLTDLTYSNVQTAACEKYLTLIYETDLALKHMMEYFEKQEDPTIIVMFGDHQPSDYVTNVVDRLTGYDPDSEDLEEAQKSFIVPYFIWSNFDLPLEDHELTSLNYVMPDIFAAAGIPMTGYQKYLLGLQEKIPVICAGTYIDAQGAYHSYDEQNELTPLLNTYNILQYNHMTDIDHRVREFFAISPMQ